MEMEHILGNRKKYLESQVILKSNIISKLPDGTLRCYNKNKYPRLYIVHPDKHVQKEFISRDKHDLAENVALRMYLEAQVNDYREELGAVAKCREIYAELRPNADEVLSELHNYKLVGNILAPKGVSELEKELIEWEQAPYNKNPYYLENLKYSTIDGRRVRSKAEQEIGSLLTLNGIHYRYEPLIEIEGRSFYADIMGRTRMRGRRFIWEHLGLVENEDYYDKAMDKLFWYAKAGYHLGVNLVITTETKDKPLGASDIMHEINRWLMD